MQSPREQQGEIKKSSLVNNANKQRKTIEWERLETSLRKLEIPREHFMGTIKESNVKDPTEAEDIKKRWQEYTELYKKCLNDFDNCKDVVIIQGQTSWDVKSSGPQEAFL